ncbi:MAG: NUDIX hydrolase [Candidatus Nanopelagicaceae bacterium]|nr:NUDIX hydrolase [Candidatus Nanopelagicaceae bacterium]
MSESHEEIAQSEYFLNLPRKRMGAGLVFVDDQDRILLVEPTYKKNWEVPGGMVELGETPRDAARREALEELGIEVTVGRLLVFDWVPPRRLPDDGVMLLYASDPIDTSMIVLPPEELISWKWCDPVEMAERLPNFMARRLDAALIALATGSVAELENGHPVGLI